MVADETDELKKIDPISVHYATYSYTLALSVDRFMYSRSSKLSMRVFTADVWRDPNEWELPSTLLAYRYLEFQLSKHFRHQLSVCQCSARFHDSYYCSIDLVLPVLHHTLGGGSVLFRLNRQARKSPWRKERPSSIRTVSFNWTWLILIRMSLCSKEVFNVKRSSGFISFVCEGHGLQTRTGKNACGLPVAFCSTSESFRKLMIVTFAASLRPL